MRSPDLHYWTALLPVFYNAPHRGDVFPASDPRQPRIILSPLLRSTTPAVNRLHGQRAAREGQAEPETAPFPALPVDTESPSSRPSWTLAIGTLKET
ncbi:uncharacterized protein LOC141574401 isoform X4 [Camelus bactrianus]|uniref:Uncharacterized protein LOC141574401 isoform X4 n=1 Tax=Camelus bactrianus TaxID=9837 RepID=A0AC58P7Q4_CAMBA